MSLTLSAGCGGGGVHGVPKLSSMNPLQTGRLQFAVGTANIYGTETGLNIVSTYRQASGASNVTVDTPTITGPFTLPSAVADNMALAFDSYSTLPLGPSAQEAASSSIEGTPQSLHVGAPICDSATACTVTNAQTGGSETVGPNTTTFGESGGVFTNGISPGNYTNNGTASSNIPYSEPLYVDPTMTATFVPFGGPPAFDPDKNGMGLRDGLSNLGTGVLGIPEGISVFAGVKAPVGTYTLSLSVPTGFSGSTPTFGSVSTSARLSSTATLPTITAPTLALDGKGGGSFAVASFPAGVTEEYVTITDYGPDSVKNPSSANCQGPLGPVAGAGASFPYPVYYTFKLSGPGTYTLPDNDGPNTDVTDGPTKLVPSPSICTAAQNTAFNGTATAGDDYTVQSIGFDYPIYEATFPITTSPAPTIVGANGQADITISAPSGTLTSAAIRRLSTLRLRHLR